MSQNVTRTPMKVGTEIYEVRSFFKPTGENLSEKMYRLMERDLQRAHEEKSNVKPESDVDSENAVCYNVNIPQTNDGCRQS